MSWPLALGGAAWKALSGLGGAWVAAIAGIGLCASLAAWLHHQGVAEERQRQALAVAEERHRQAEAALASLDFARKLDDARDVEDQNERSIVDAYIADLRKKADAAAAPAPGNSSPAICVVGDDDARRLSAIGAAPRGSRPAKAPVPAGKSRRRLR